ncbi:MAG TPA: serine hydrolase domain-containing protein [Planctomycetota bacterium]|nr:serine hydrolase domain-containing protein [Planctomycetota bacterium]
MKIFLLIAIAWSFFKILAGEPPAPQREFDAVYMDNAAAPIADAIAAKKIPGAVLLCGRHDKILFEKAYGNRSVNPEAVPMTTDTIFDMASVTKTVACATSIMILVDRGKLKVSDLVSKYIPEFTQNGKESITIEQLLLHRSGLIPDNPISDYRGTRDEMLANVYKLKPDHEPNTHFAYSDVNYIVLGELVRIVSGKPLNEFAKTEIFEPLGMKDTAYLPPESWKPRIAVTEKRDGKWTPGDVHDPRSFALGKVAGHAGVFSTAEDMARFCRMILNGGELDGKRILSKATLDEMTKPRAMPDKTNSRGYGFDIDTPYSPSARGKRFAVGTTFGHTGFTGTMFWIDPEHDCFVVFLTNRINLGADGNDLAVRGKVSTIAAEAFLGPKQ